MFESHQINSPPECFHSQKLSWFQPRSDRLLVPHVAPIYCCINWLLTLNLATSGHCRQILKENTNVPVVLMLPCWSRGIYPVSTFWSFSKSSGKLPVISFLGGEKRYVSQKDKIYPISKQLTAIKIYYSIVLPFNLYYLSILPVSGGYFWLYSPDFLNKGHNHVDMNTNHKHWLVSLISISVTVTFAICLSELPPYDDSLTFPFNKKPNFLSLLKVKVKYSQCVTKGNTRKKWPLPGHGQREQISYKPLQELSLHSHFIVILFHSLQLVKVPHSNFTDLVPFRLRWMGTWISRPWALSERLQCWRVTCCAE